MMESLPPPFSSSSSSLPSSSSSSSSLPPGVVFNPTQREILQEFLARKVHNLPLPHNAIVEMNVYDHQPWLYASGDNMGMGKYSKYYFVRREKKSNSESAKNPIRRLKSEGNSGARGWWQAITGDKPIRGKQGRIIGFQKTLKFCSYKNQKYDRRECVKTGWIMHEYKLPHPTFQEWVVCGIRYNARKGIGEVCESQSVGHNDAIYLSKEDQLQSQSVGHNDTIYLNKDDQPQSQSVGHNDTIYLSKEDQSQSQSVGQNDTIYLNKDDQPQSQSVGHNDTIYLSKEDQLRCPDQQLQQEGCSISMLEDQPNQAHQDLAYDQICNAYPLLNIGLGEQASGLGCHSALELGNQAEGGNRSLQLNGSNVQEMTNNNGLLRPGFCGLNDPSWYGFQDAQVQLPSWYGFQDTQVQLPQVGSSRESQLQDYYDLWS